MDVAGAPPLTPILLLYVEVSVRNTASRVAKALPRVAVIGILSFAAASIAIPSAASASGTSGRTLGCYAQWYNTYFKGVCDPAEKNGYYQLNAYCDYEGDFHGDWKHKDKGYRGTFDDDDCTFAVTGGYIAYAGD
ncbi:hypothetical protein [Micromonospora tulbaghiae]|uniref:hypothetical protein n=1 Tax=Micromonospora tulbaghiae TaxID=479978 RepID=UPI00367BD5FD